MKRLGLTVAIGVTLALGMAVGGGDAGAQAQQNQFHTGMAHVSAAVRAPASQMGTSFTYQGQIKKDGGAYSGTCDFQFGLWDAAADGTSKGSVTKNGIDVLNGQFAAELDFGDQFNGDARWLEIAVNCADADYTTMTPRVLLTSSPYALSLRPGATISSTGTTGLTVLAPNGNPIIGVSSAVGYAGVFGRNDNNLSYGVYGVTNNGSGVYGEAQGQGGKGVYGFTGDAPNGTGVYGEANAVGAVGVYGKSEQNTGVFGSSIFGRALWGLSAQGTGVYGESQTTGGQGVSGFNSQTNSIGVYGEANAVGSVGVYGRSILNTGVYGWSVNGNGVWGKSTNGYAGYFQGKVGITGGADLAEKFDIASTERIEPGTLLVIDAANPGKLAVSALPYDSKVAGVVSGAGGVNPGLTLHQEGLLEGDYSVAIAGRVYVKADARSAPIQPGDLLTTSSLPGHAMKATDRALAQGAIIGKAMSTLDSGTGLVLVLVNLQ